MRNGQNRPLAFVRLLSSQAPRLQYLLGLWAFGAICIALVTWVSFSLRLNATIVMLAYLAVIVFLSLLDSFVSSLVFSVIAIACLNYFFIEPLFTFQVASPQDVLALIVFGITSLVITSLVRRIQRLSEAHREQAKLLDLTHDTVTVRDLNDVIRFWNRGAEELYGWTKEEALGQQSDVLLQSQFLSPQDDPFATLMRSGRWDGEIQRKRKNGTFVTVSSRWALQRDAPGNPIATLETNNDVTEQKRAQESLQRIQRTYLAEAQKLSATGSFGWNAATGDLHWSDETYRIFDYDVETRPSLSKVLDRVHPDDRAFVGDLFMTAASDLRGAIDCECRLSMPDEAVKYVHIVAHRLSGGSPSSQYIGAVMDVTSAKQAAQQVQQLHEDLAHLTRVASLGELTASIAHEVNQPLTAIGTNGEASLRWLDRDPPDLNEVVVCIERIIRDTRRASDVVQRIQSFIKKANPEKVVLNLNELIEEVISLLQRDISQHRIAMQLELSPSLEMVSGDRIQLQQVIINLMINSIQAMKEMSHEPRHLAIRTWQDEDGMIAFAIRDSGAGIAEEAANRLFKAFFTTKSNGMGMGLAICRSIIEGHDGKIWAQANPTERGAIFQFRLPALPREYRVMPLPNERSYH